DSSDRWHHYPHGGDHGCEREERVSDHADIQHSDVAGIRPSRLAWTSRPAYASVVRDGIVCDRTDARDAGGVCISLVIDPTGGNYHPSFVWRVLPEWVL